VRGQNQAQAKPLCAVKERLLPQTRLPVRDDTGGGWALRDGGPSTKRMSAPARLRTRQITKTESRGPFLANRDLLQSAQAAGRGFKRRRNSAGLAAPGESVVREFLQSKTTGREPPTQLAPTTSAPKRSPYRLTLFLLPSQQLARRLHLAFPPSPAWFP
jgi:hypothetical protein